MIRLLIAVLLFASLNAVAEVTLTPLNNNTPADADDVMGNFNALNEALPPSDCTTDQIIKWDDTNGVWVCAGHEDVSGLGGFAHIYGYSTGTGGFGGYDGGLGGVTVNTKEAIDMFEFSVVSARGIFSFDFAFYAVSTGDYISIRRLSDSTDIAYFLVDEPPVSAGATWFLSVDPDSTVISGRLSFEDGVDYVISFK